MFNGIPIAIYMETGICILELMYIKKSSFVRKSRVLIHFTLISV